MNPSPRYPHTDLDLDYIPDEMCRVLVVAYYFPPMGLSGVQRITKFVKYLRTFNWEPTVLTVDPQGYFAFDESLMDEVQRLDVEIVRVASRDPTALFSPGKKVAFPGERRRRMFSLLSQALFIPDNKRGWIRPAVVEGMRILSKKRYDAIFSTAPPYSAHLVGLRLSAESNLPLITDFRDDWVGNPRHTYVTPWHRRKHESLERKVVRNSDAVTTINRRIQGNLVERNLGAEGFNRVFVLPQGYDPDDFNTPRKEARPGKMTFLYTGMFYDAQQPDTFLRALRVTLDRSPRMRSEVRAVFVGLFPERARDLVRELQLEEIVDIRGYLPHDETVEVLRAADVLWLTVGDVPGNETISTGKLHEYLGTRKPILGLVPAGAARDVLQKYRASKIIEPLDVDGVSGAVETMYEMWRNGSMPEPDEEYVKTFDRLAITRQLASILSRAAHIDTVL
jgi:glycosyltransferase involved in cell wall biosynthesis